MFNESIIKKYIWSLHIFFFHSGKNWAVTHTLSYNIFLQESPKSTTEETVVLTFDGEIGTEIVIKLVSPLRGEPPIVSDTEVEACIHPKGKIKKHLLVTPEIEQLL